MTDPNRLADAAKNAATPEQLLNDLERLACTCEPAIGYSCQAHMIADALRSLMSSKDAERLDWLDANPQVIVRSGKQHIRPLIDIAMKAHSST